jgi:hypothetical protein
MRGRQHRLAFFPLPHGHCSLRLGNAGLQIGSRPDLGFLLIVSLSVRDLMPDSLVNVKENQFHKETDKSKQATHYDLSKD